MANSGGLGRRTPVDWTHVSKYPIRGVLQASPSITVERHFQLPWWHWTHDQGSEGACVGHGTGMTMAIVNTKQRREAGAPKPWTARYDCFWLWDRAKERDSWPDTNPGDDNGTSVDAACQVARDIGLLPLDKRHTKTTPQILDGIETYRWATSVDDMRVAIAGGGPVTIGVNWYENFDAPEKGWIGKGDLGKIRGGHCVCIYGASDRRQAFRLKNSWGKNYPLVWLPYEVMERLIKEDGEASIITDK